MCEIQISQAAARAREAEGLARDLGQTCIECERADSALIRYRTSDYEATTYINTVCAHARACIIYRRDGERVHALCVCTVVCGCVVQLHIGRAFNESL